MYAFELALSHVKQGGRIVRVGWNGKGLCVSLNRGYDTFGGKSLPYLILNYQDGTVVPWHPSQTDILADDWQLLPPEALNVS